MAAGTPVPPFPQRKQGVSVCGSAPRTTSRSGLEHGGVYRGMQGYARFRGQTCLSTRAQWCA